MMLQKTLSLLILVFFSLMSIISEAHTTSRITNSYVPDNIIPNDTKTTPGFIEISSDVSKAGARTYNVPIKVPNGMNNHTPNISLEYSSQRGNTICGHGWNLSGISKIVRTSKSIYFDKEVNPISTLNDDAFALDGVRLIKTGNEGSSILYATFMGQIKVKAIISNNKISHFEVYFPNGKYAVYGDSQSNCLEYPIKEFYDSFGNCITYSYVSDGGQELIREISYNSHKLEFYYQHGRTDYTFSFAGGKKIIHENLLKGIIVSYNGNNLGTYSINYESSSGHSYINEIGFSNNLGFSSQMSNDNLKLNSLKFYYGSGKQADSFSKTTGYFNSYYVETDEKPATTIKGRFSYNNSREGLAVFPSVSNYSHRNSTWLTHSQDKFYQGYTGDESIYIYQNLEANNVSPYEIKTSKGFVDLITADIDGTHNEHVIRINNTLEYAGQDGRADYLSFFKYKGGVNGITPVSSITYRLPTVFTDNDGNQSPMPKDIFSGDFNGDGITEVLVVTYNKPVGRNYSTRWYLLSLKSKNIMWEGAVAPYNINISSSYVDELNKSDKIIPVDINGDGKTEILHITENGTNVYAFNKTSSGANNFVKIGSTDAIKRETYTNRDIYCGDFNHDGLIDLILTPIRNSNNSDWTVMYSKGDCSFEKQVPTLCKYLTADKKYLLHDVNSDGATDLICYDENGFSAYIDICTNTPYSAYQKVIHTSFTDKGSKLVPFNTNSRTSYCDLIGIKDNKFTRYSFSRNESLEGVITGMVNSAGAVEKTDYGLLTEKNAKYGAKLYQFDTKSKYDSTYVIINEPISVVEASETYLEGTPQIFTSYQYKNGVAHRYGLGYLGFEEVTRHTPQGIVRHSYDQKLRGIIKTESTPTDSTYYDNILRTKEDNRTLVLPIRKIHLDKATGIKDSTLYVYDNYGYPMNSKTYWSDGVSSSTFTDYRHNDTVDIGYRLGFILSETNQTTRNQHDYSTSFTIERDTLGVPIEKIFTINNKELKRIIYSYDNYGNCLSEVTTYNDGKRFSKTTAYDGFGNITDNTDEFGLKESSYRYDVFGRPSSVSKRDEPTINYTYDALGRVISEKNSHGYVHNIRYSWSGREGGRWEITDSYAGQPTKITTYDAYNREIRTTSEKFDGKYVNIVTKYDKYGRVMAKSEPYVGRSLEPNSWKHTYEYDIFGRQTSHTKDSIVVSKTSYTGLTIKTTERKVTTSRTYDSGGFLTKVSDPTMTVSFSLDGDGQPLRISTSTGVTTSFEYDDFRRRTVIKDPSGGRNVWKYDGVGNILEEVHPDAGRIRYWYDNYNRLFRRNAGTVELYYYRDGSSLPYKVTGNVTELYDYTDGMLSSSTHMIDSISLSRTYNYTDGNLSSVNISTAHGIDATERFNYTKGHLTSVTLNDRDTLYKLLSEDKYGRPIKAKSGSLIREYEFDKYGFPIRRSIKTEVFQSDTAVLIPGKGLNKANTQGPLVGPGIPPFEHELVQMFIQLTENYYFDPETMNLMRRDILGGSEYFNYDPTNRLIGYGNNTAGYDNNGNITSRSEVGFFNYDNQSRPYAVTSINTVSNAIPLRNQYIEYGKNRRPKSIEENGWRAEFLYDTNDDRCRMTLTHDGEQDRIKYYLGGCYEIEFRNGSFKEHLYLNGDYYSASNIIIRDSKKSNLCHIFRDYLGSIVAVISGSSALGGFKSYDAWGRPRTYNNNTKEYDYYDGELYIGRGYTGHEHLPWFGLINMNARLYDPAVGRFLSPDPIVQAPDQPQNFNRYSYCLNNPLTFKDENGEFIVVTIISAVVESVVNLVSHGFNFKKYNYNFTKNVLKYDFIIETTLICFVYNPESVMLELGSAITQLGISALYNLIF